MPDRRAIGRRSKSKGKRGERQAAAYLRSLGFDYRRTVQYKGTGDSSDITGDLVHLFIEVKDDKSVKIGTKAWRDAYWRAVEDAGGERATREAVLLHKERGAWFLTFGDNQLVAAGDKAIRSELLRLNYQRGLVNDARLPLVNPTGPVLTGLLREAKASVALDDCTQSERSDK